MFSKYLTPMWVSFGAVWFVLGVLAESPEAFIVSICCVFVAWVFNDLQRP